ncbi:MAG: hypothetical protein LBT78_01385 [Tannerella sp.]|jgi:hypothetical protein|nr:hypothetical protein [Tannerella sp.]
MNGLEKIVDFITGKKRKMELSRLREQVQKLTLKESQMQHLNVYLKREAEKALQVQAKSYENKILKSGEIHAIEIGKMKAAYLAQINTLEEENKKLTGRLTDSGDWETKCQEREVQIMELEHKILMIQKFRNSRIQ